ncbi:uncharacterized protein V1510DRAFT_406538 [Dipodascopsis tothii]|uniref:uncharacterized protein n=1 Tax=Dipodascopsis tothii TaxID=44089 RepID=UPI0034D00E62
MSASTSSAKASEGSASNRNHNQGRQSREYTPAQAAAVNRVRKCKHDEFYAILDIERTSTDGEIKRAYRKLALLMHPDKNGAPGADEAFKMVSKAFQVLSDSDKKRIFDQTGSDPESRASSMPSGFSRAAGGGGGGVYEDVSPEELFNMFFGGQGFGQGFGGGFQSFSGFGGPGIRVQSFGGSPFGSFARGGAPPRRPAGGAAPTEGELNVRSLIQFLPLLLLFLLPLLTSLFDTSSSSGNSFWSTQPTFQFTPAGPYTAERFTPKYNVPYYVNPKETSAFNARKLAQLDTRAETTYINRLQVRCENEYDLRQRRLSDAQGWFFVDQEKYDKAMATPMESCERLQSLGLRLRNR